MSETILSVKNMTVKYISREVGVCHAVNDVSFDVKKGETIGLVGETGAGKTTIALSILRLLPAPPARVESGEILFGGEDILKMSDSRMRNIRGDRISMIFQDPMTALNPIDKVGDQISEMVKLHLDLNNAQAAGKAAEMLEMVGIPAARFYDYPHQFSGGMKQRVIIAIALACKPELLLADEPTTALDVTIQAQVLELMRGIKDKLNMAMMLITHDLGVIAEMADDILVMYAGKVVEHASALELFKNPKHPYTAGLMRSKPNILQDQEKLHTIPGNVPSLYEMPEGCPFHPRCENAMDICASRFPDTYPISGAQSVACWLYAPRASGKEGGGS